MVCFNYKEVFLLHYYLTCNFSITFCVAFSVDPREAMAVLGIWLVVWQFATTILYKLLRLVFITVQWIYWQLNGTAQKIREARLPHNYERSAQVVDVVFFHKFCPMQLITVDNFLFTHNRFENPQYIIDNDDITLMSVNEHDAIFCEPKEKGKLRLFVNNGM